MFAILSLEPAILWALALLAIGLAAMVLEMFVPSAGVLGVVAIIALLGAVGMAFTAGPLAGASMLVAVTLLVPILLGAMVKYWPHTSWGKLIMLKRPLEDRVLPETAGYRTLPKLVGKTGTARSAMYPSGVVEIDGQSFDAVSDSLPIERGETVRVVGLDTQRLVVRSDVSPLAESPKSDASGGESPQIEDPFA